MFFFGKKEPKNFSPFGAARLGLSAANGESLFASFSSEKEESLLTETWPTETHRDPPTALPPWPAAPARTGLLRWRSQ
jgi:hypothetical protein